jgi:phosphate/phosphite/phosphonate ABC transporter binding protein
MYFYSVPECRVTLPALILTVLLGLFITGCGSESGYKYVDFSETIQVDQPPDDDRVQPPNTATLRVAVAAMVSPKETFVYYQEILNYIGDKLNNRIQLIQRKTYNEINDLMLQGEIELAFICSGPYAMGREKFGFEALATPLVREKPFYQSYLIVNKESPFQKLSDLRGHIFAFTDPDSNTGYLVPKYWLSEMGEQPESFFSTVNYTYSHDNSILAIARSLVDGATVDGHIWEYYHSRNPTHTSQTRIIKKSELFGSPPLVASSYLRPKLKIQIQNLIVTMHQTPEGHRILKELMIDRFVEPRSSWYESVRHMRNRVHRFEEAHGVEKS